MHKTLILVAESIHVDQDVVKYVKEVEMALTTQLRSVAKKINNLKSELAILKGSDISAPTSIQLETAYQEVSHLKAKLIATPAMLEVAGKGVSKVSQVVNDFMRVISELKSASFAKDEKLVSMHAEYLVSRMLPVSLRTRKWIYKLKYEKVSHEVALVSCQADFYKFGYVDHLQGRSFNYEFSENDFETFSISPVDQLDCSFEAALGGVAEGQVVQARAVEDEFMEAMAAKSDAAAEGVAVERPVVAQVANE
ncbi:hypothetical protein PS2_018866 [Malus domestica]